MIDAILAMLEKIALADDDVHVLYEGFTSHCRGYNGTAHNACCGLPSASGLASFPGRPS